MHSHHQSMTVPLFHNLDHRTYTSLNFFIFANLVYKNVTEYSFICNFPQWVRLNIFQYVQTLREIFIFLLELTISFANVYWIVSFSFVRLFGFFVLFLVGTLYVKETSPLEHELQKIVHLLTNGKPSVLDTTEYTL